MTTIAVAVDIGGHGGGNGSKRAVKWAVENLLSQADHFVLVHVMPTITHIPTPSGNSIPITELDTKVVAKYMEDVREKSQAVFLQYRRLYKPGEMQFETLLIEYDNIAAGLVNYIMEANVRSLVLGSESLNRFWRRIKGHGIPQLVLKNAPDTCDIFVVSKRRVKTKVASSMTTNETGGNKLPIVVTTGQTPLHSSSSVEPSTGFSQSEFSQSISLTDVRQGSYSNDINARSNTSHSSTTSAYTDASSVGQMSTSDTLVSYEQFDLHNDVEQLRLELQTTLALYNRACEDLVHAQKKVRILSSECVVEAEKINAATEREETMKKIAEQEKMKLLRAEKDAQAAKNLLAKESYERQIAELNALKEFKERQKIVDALISNERRIRRYTPDEIRVATEDFSEKKIIGEGGYGKVYRGTLDHTPVAIKVLEHDATDKKEEFLREIRILSQLCHPNIVLLLGVCSEMGCLVYEYMENGSLEELIFRQKGRAPLPWFARFRIAFEIACGLAFLHRRKPEPIVHRDLKPGNILLGRNYVTKISDVGLAKLVSDNIPDSVTMFGNSLLAGTLYYIDPEYQRTGTVRPKSDLYSFGIILLQLLTARSPNGLLLVMENAIASGSLPYILDDSIKDWPLAEVEELTKLALECCKLRCRDRPDLETVVLPVLRKLADVADASMKVERNSIFAPSHYFCPILHEIMDDPHVAADGFTYERRAIEAWLERHDISPVTKQKMTHFNLTPNMTLLTAIQEWKSRLASTHP
ncbi:U-box domain-containing protein 34-like [Chenopodium quinoa]|uniref:Serine/threonine-protein kinase n=1 Tax=Chenopodium quinoa TaxID=63459 RepID=A0A803MGC6_CHEQI|nr:U-box domain-containing protein 34-like [Chenopodium quinoa]